MKRINIYLITVLMLVIVLSGCGKKPKDENQLSEDLKNNSNFFMVEGCEITNLSIIKRLTDDANKKDTIYVSVKLDHSAAEETRAYIMYYTKYNDGWMLDSIEEYRGEEVEWKVTSKAPPTNEEIMEWLIAYSNDQIEMNFNDDYGELNHFYNVPITYFFEEGKYATKIYSGEMNTDGDYYTCYVETERIYDLVDVTEGQILRFQFDWQDYRWELCESDIVELSGEWHIEGDWNIVFNDMNVTFEEADESGYGHDAYVDYRVYGEKTEYSPVYGEIREYSCDDIRRIYCPSSLEMNYTIYSLDHYGDISGKDIVVTPNDICIYNILGDGVQALERISSSYEGKNLEEIGIIDKTSKDPEKEKEYLEVVKEVVTCLYDEQRYSELEDKLLINNNYGKVTVEDFAWIKEIFADGELSSIIPIETILYDMDLPEMKEIIENGDEEFGLLPNTLEGAATVTVCCEYWKEGEVFYCMRSLPTIKINGKIYVILS